MTKKFKITRYKKTLICLASILTLLLSTPFILTPILSGKSEQILTATKFPKKNQMPIVNSQNHSVKIMTLNLAHGRSDGFSQLLLNKKTIRNNLNTIAGVIKRENPDIVALQEADGPSIWSGKFNHVEYLAELAGFSNSIRGEHVKGLQLSYGTAMLSKYPITESKSFTFAPSPPTFTKGFIVATMEIPQLETKVDIVSVHLDFASKSVREKQVKNMIKELSKHPNPIIIMGDFNCQLTDKKSAINLLTEKLGLRAYQPDNPDMITFPILDQRLDWILVSPQLEFKAYSTLKDTISDHYAVVCELKKEPESLFLANKQ